MGVYCINAARYLFQDEPVEVVAETRSSTDAAFSRGRRDDVRRSSPLPGEASSRSSSPARGRPRSRNTGIVGTKGDIRVEPALGYAGELREHFSAGGRSEEKTFSVHDQFAPELVYFSNCILQDREPVAFGRRRPRRRSHPGGDRAVCGDRTRCVKLAPFERKARPIPALEMTKPPVRRYVDLVHALFTDAMTAASVTPWTVA